MRLAALAAGAMIGAKTGPAGSLVFNALAGALLGFVLVEWTHVRDQIARLENEIAKLRALPARPDERSRERAAETAPAAATELAEAGEQAQAQELALAQYQAPSQAQAPIAPRISAEPPREFMPRIVDAIRGFFMGGNSLVRAGVVVLFFGVAFLLRYVAEHSRVPIEFRLTGVAAGALVLLALGWRLRKSRPGYALALQGGAVGILNLTIFAALHLYSVLPAPAAFGLLAVLAALSATLAVLQDSLAFALLAVTGGFLAPILSSTGAGNHVVLFSYYAVLNLGIVAIAWFKAWRPLNLAGFLFTFVIGTVWGVLRYRAQDFATTEPFLVAFFLFYVAVAVLFTLRQPPNLRGYVDGTLVFGLPIVAFGLQSAMLHDRLLVLAFSAVGVSALYLLIAWLLHRGSGSDRRVLIEAFIALGVAFLTLAVPLALEGRWNAATWALEGSALIWIGCRQQRVLPRLSGALLTIAAGCVLAPLFDSGRGHVLLAWGDYLGLLAVSGASIFSARTLALHRTKLAGYEYSLASVLFIWGLIWWLLGGATEITQYVRAGYVAAADLGLFALTAWLSSEFHRRIPMQAARLAALALLPVMTLCAALAVGIEPHPFARGGFVAWPFAFAILYRLAHRHEGSPGASLSRVLHVGSAWLLCVLLSWEAAWQINAAVQGSGSWPAAGWAAIAAVALFFLPDCVKRMNWPFGAHRDAYLFTAGLGFAVYLALWSVITNAVLPGDADPLPYAPLLNPLDVAQGLVLMVIVRYGIFVRAARPGAAESRLLPFLATGLAFIWFNAVLLRTLHQWYGVGFSVEAFAQSTLVQACISIFWAVLALTTMLVAARKSSRVAWLLGAALLTVVVAKLFLVDLSRIGSIERIVSFVGVGLLMLVVGYWSPLPPAADARR